jgi:hypothetical protein
MIQIKLGDYFLQGSNGWTLEAHNANTYATEKEAEKVLEALKLTRARVNRDPRDSKLPAPHVTGEEK